jgi:hypothetical protein
VDSHSSKRRCRPFHSEIETEGPAAAISMFQWSGPLGPHSQHPRQQAEAEAAARRSQCPITLR